VHMRHTRSPHHCLPCRSLSLVRRQYNCQLERYCTCQVGIPHTRYCCSHCHSWPVSSQRHRPCRKLAPPTPDTYPLRMHCNGKQKSAKLPKYPFPFGSQTFLPRI
jgi:hypothetical protein